MSVYITATRDLLIGWVNAGNFTPVIAAGITLVPAIAAAAIYDAYYGLADLRGGRIIIMPRAKTLTLSSRGGAIDRRFGFDIAVQYKYKSTAPAEMTAEVDPWLSVAEAICESLPTAQLANKAICLEIEHNPLFVDKHLQEFRVFTTVVTPYFKLF